MFSIGRWYAEQCAREAEYSFPGEIAQQWLSTRQYHETIMGTPLQDRAADILSLCSPYLDEVDPDDDPEPRFEVENHVSDINNFTIKDYRRQVVSTLPRALLEDPEFNIGEWYNH